MIVTVSVSELLTQTKGHGHGNLFKCPKNYGDPLSLSTSA
jgi:hypothetical protein